MQIYYLDRDPTLCAQALGDRHLTEFGSDLLDIVVTVHRSFQRRGFLDDLGAPNRLSDRGEVAWAFAAVNHYSWALRLLQEMSAERIYRFGVPLGRSELLTALVKHPIHPSAFPARDAEYWVDPPQKLETRFDGTDQVVRHRRAYVDLWARTDIIRYTRREMPSWLRTMASGTADYGGDV